MSSRLPVSSSVKNSSADAAAAAPDRGHRDTSGDRLLAGTATSLTCNDSEVKVEVNADTSGEQLSDEAGGV